MPQKILWIGLLLIVAAGQIFEIVTTFFIIKGAPLMAFVVENVIMVSFFLVIYRKIRPTPQSIKGSSKNRSAWFR